MMPASDRIRLLFDAYELANRLSPTLVYITPAVAQDLMSEYADKRLPERVHDMLVCVMHTRDPYIDDILVSRRYGLERAA